VPDTFTNPVSFTQKSYHSPDNFISPTRPELSCAGRNVVVAGGSDGIGLAISIGFATAKASSITILGRREWKLQEAVKAISDASSGDTRTTVAYQVVDIVNKTQVDSAFDYVVRTFGKIDILVSNAAAPVAMAPISTLEAEDLTTGFQINVIGALNLVQAFLPLAGQEPVVLNTSTCMTHFAPTPNFGNYTATKSAALRLFDTLAAENPHIHIVNVQPGWVATAANGYQEIAPDTGNVMALSVYNPPELTMYIAKLPGHFYVWLASPEAKCLRGKFVWANWDAQELLQRSKEISESMMLRIILDGVPM
jgi:NAD(P)-dependent dehydrogenase (short-subunit alcohol dehydrogenase family)